MGNPHRPPGFASLAMIACCAAACGGGGKSGATSPALDAAVGGDDGNGGSPPPGGSSSSGGTANDASGSSSGGDDASGSTTSSGGGDDGGSTRAGADGGSGEAGSGPACSVAQVGPDGDFKGYRMFPADHPINTAIDTLPVSSHSADWLANCSPAHAYLQLDLSMPYNVVAANTPPVTATSFDYNSKPYPNPWPFPANAVIEGGDPTTSGDHHCLAFDVGNCKLYEVYNILWGSGMTTFTAASGTVWDTTVDDPGNGSGSDAAGLPITPLLIRGDELVGAGAINHALRFTCAASEQGHIAPARASASSSAGSGVPSNPHDLTFPPMGMRVRLKASYDPTAHSFPAPIVAILKAIQKYGLLLADNGGSNSPMFITGSTDAALTSALSDPAYLIKQITTADLEVADTGSVTQD
ncbi:MAG TPA: hypothetical protein VK762_04170 [Polyangiaceae bacterium]|nr:hypothetical protein [Polyangiaceae bacterium]